MKEPKGGFYLFPDFENFREAFVEKGIDNSVAMCNSILDQAKVAILPGSAFLKEANSLTARLAFVNFDGKRVLSEFEKDSLSLTNPVNESFIRRVCPDTTKATETLCNWTKSFQ